MYLLKFRFSCLSHDTFFRAALSIRFNSELNDPFLHVYDQLHCPQQIHSLFFCGEQKDALEPQMQFFSAELQPESI